MQASDRLLEVTNKGKKQQDVEGFAPPDQKITQKLNQLATKKLAEIVRRYTAGEKLWQGYDASEIAAAKELLAKATSDVVR